MDKKLIVAFLYNVRHVYPDPNDSRTQLETDFDDPETIEELTHCLQKAGFNVIPIEANENAYFELKKHKSEIDIAFNYSEGIYGKDRYCHLPAILEILQIPYTGSSPLTQALVLNKGKTKEILIANKIPTADFQVFENPAQPLKEGLKFPLIVKPVSQGSSAGITNKSIVNNLEELKEQVKTITQTFSAPALVETFLPGRDFSVPMMGNPPKIYPVIESNHTTLPKGYQPIDSLEVKWYLEEEGGSDHLVCPPKIDVELKNKIEDICKKTWNALNILDWCRIDVRCDDENNPHVLDINSPCGMIPPAISMTSYFAFSARTIGISFEELLKTLIGTALKRYSK